MLTPNFSWGLDKTLDSRRQTALAVTATRLSFVVLLKLASEMSKLQEPTSDEVGMRKKNKAHPRLRNGWKVISTYLRITP